MRKGRGGGDVRKGRGGGDVRKERGLLLLLLLLPLQPHHILLPHHFLMPLLPLLQSTRCQPRTTAVTLTLASTL